MSFRAYEPSQRPEDFRPGLEPGFSFLQCLIINLYITALRQKVML